MTSGDTRPEGTEDHDAEIRLGRRRRPDRPDRSRAPGRLGPQPRVGLPGRHCFWTRSVNNFASADPHTVNVRVGVRDVYQLEMIGSCPDVDWATRIAIVSRSGSSICTGMDAELIAPSPIGPQRCPVRAVRKLTEAEIAALPRGARP